MTVTTSDTLSWRHRLVARYCRAAEHPGRLRLLRLLKRITMVSTVRAEVAPGVIMDLDEADFVQRELLYRGTYEPLTLRRVDELLPAARGFIDIGAHHGLFTLRAARSLSPRGGRVFAFEPNPPSASALMRNAGLSCLSNITLFAVALSDAPTLCALQIPPASNSGSARITEPEPLRSSGSQILVAAWPARLPETLVSDEAFDLVKIDVEGHEAHVLAALIDSGRPRPRNLLVEFRPDVFNYGLPVALPQWLGQHGYEVRTVNGDPYIGGSPPEDNLWARLLL